MYQIRFPLGLGLRPRWVSLQHSPVPLTAFKEPTSKERGKGEEEKGMGKWGEGREGRRERPYAPLSHIPGYTTGFLRIYHIRRTMFTSSRLSHSIRRSVAQTDPTKQTMFSSLRRAITHQFHPRKSNLPRLLIPKIH